VLIALVSAGAVLIMARAQGGKEASADPTPGPGRDPFGDCSNCHKDIYDVWQKGLHGKALNDPIFAYEWNAEGNPDACLICHATGYDPTTGQAIPGIGCSVCHNPIPANHPTDPMPVNNSSDLCGKCHADPRFAVEDWQMSAHYLHGIQCTTCHDPHAAGMTVVGPDDNATDASALCENCHKDTMQNFPVSQHAQAGVTCVNCHLGFNVRDANTSPVDFSSVHKAPDHKFLPSLDTCTKCHANQMHAPGPAVAAAAIKIEEAGGTPTPIEQAINTRVPPVTNQLPPESPIGLAGAAGLLGLAGGMVVAPWLDRTYRRHGKEDHHG
jgi:hypothetical protein